MAYSKTNWENAPSTNTPINAGNLNKIEEGIYQNSLKADQVGDLTNLKTTDKTNIVSSINELKDGETYSTSEVKTNRVWIDGKSIYRKVVINNTTSTTGSWQYISLGTINIDSITFTQVIAKLTDSEIYTDANYINTGYNWNYRFNKVNNTFDYLQNGYKNISVVIIIEYTKTTD